MNWLAKFKKTEYLKKQRGAIFVLTALLLPIMFGCLGIAYDVGNIYMHKARLQNVADAAALAGGRAYLESQAKTTGTKDDIDEDENHTGHGVKNPYTYTIAGINNRTGIDGITYDSRKHADADKAADDYIYKNIINLGETIHADKYSHFALKGIKKNADAEGEETTYTSTDDVFYRVGLEETVPLHFLPVITNKNAETVRAGSVVLVQPGTTTVIPGSGGGSTTVTNPSIFDNLFTYSEYFDTGLANENNKVNATYVGNMVFTYGNGSSSQSAFYNIDKIINNSTQSVDHIFSDDTDAADYLSSMRDNPSETSASAWAKVNDPTIDTYYNTTAYTSAFENKLNETHIDVYKTTLSASDINDHNGSLYNQQVKIDNKSVQQKGGVLYVKDLIAVFSRHDVVELEKIIRKPYFVPESKKIDGLLREFKRKHIHIAIAIDEYGGISGIVCMEDIIEEIVGDIQDEFDNEREDIISLGNNVWLCDARVDLDNLNEVLDAEFPTGDFDTLGGFVFDLFGKIPVKFEKVSWNGFDFIVQEMEGHKVDLIKVIKKQSSDNKSENHGGNNL